MGKRITIVLPKFGYEVERGTIASWRAQPGDRVAKGDRIAVVEMDKGTVDLEAPADGRITDLLVGEGTEVPIGQVIAYLEEPDIEADT